MGIPQCIYLQYDLAILLLDIYPGEVEVYVQIKIDVQMFIRSLLALAKNRQQNKCPPVVDFSIRDPSIGEPEWIEKYSLLSFMEEIVLNWYSFFFTRLLEFIAKVSESEILFVGVFQTKIMFLYI